MAKSRKKKKKQRLIILLLVISCFGIYYLIYKRSVNVVDEIKDFGYTLDKNDSDLMKLTYEELKEELSKKDLDDEKYAQIIAKLFIIDLYTIDTKENIYDIGGCEYIIPSKLDSYKLKVQDTLYNYLSNKKNRTEELPIVSSVTVDNFQKDGNNYIVNLSWQYKKDLGYDTKGEINLSKENNKIYVVSYKGGE